MTQETIGARIADYRKKKGATQEELATYLSVSPQAVSKWENEVSYPDITLLTSIADFFKITTDELLGGKTNQNASDVGDRKIKIYATGFGANEGLFLDLIMPYKLVANSDGILHSVKQVPELSTLLLSLESGITGVIVDKVTESVTLKITIE